MLDFLKGFKKDNDICSPVKGTCVDITEVKDEAFSSKMMGDGVAIVPNESVIYAPCDGVLTMVFPTKHALGIRLDDGVELMVHIGVDTVNLNGEGFVSYVKQNQRVKKGMKLISFDEQYLYNKDLDFTTILVLTSGSEYYYKMDLHENVDVGSIVLKRCG